jgi:signal peptide peptidase SppA
MELNLSVGSQLIPFYGNWIGSWAMHEPYFHSLREQLTSLNLTMHLANSDQNRAEAMQRIEDSFATSQEGIGVINIDGPMMKHASSFSSSCSTVEVRRILNQFANDGNIKGIVLRIDSPGGTVAGTKELADAIVEAKAKKPVWAFCNDLTASAAYWIASQCDRIEANSTSLVGSIGTYCVVADSSKAADEAGVKIHVVRAGEFKGMGTPGTEVTDAHLAELLVQVKGLNMFFLDAVSTGRGMAMDQVSTLADGRVHLASEAKTLGLIDDVSAFEDFFDRFTSSVSSPGSPVSQKEESDMSAENTAKPATIAEIEGKFPKASSEWKLACLKAGWTMAQCQESFCEQMQLEVEAAQKRAEAAEKLASNATTKPGVDPLKSKSRARAEDMPKDDDEEEVDPEATDDMDEDEDEAEAKWKAAVQREMVSCGNDRAKAVRQANRKHPKLRAAYVASVNRNRQVARR